MTGGDIETEREIGSRLVSGGGDGIDRQLEKLFDGTSRRSEAAFVGTQRTLAVALRDQLGGRLIDRPGPGEGVVDRGGSVGDQQDVLDFDLTAGMFATGKEIDRRTRQHRELELGVEDRGEVPVERHTLFDRDRPREGKRYPQQGVRAQTGFVRRAVERDQGGIELLLRC